MWTERQHRERQRGRSLLARSEAHILWAVCLPRGGLEGGVGWGEAWWVGESKVGGGEWGGCDSCGPGSGELGSAGQDWARAFRKWDFPEGSARLSWWISGGWRIPERARLVGLVPRRRSSPVSEE